MRLFYKVSLAFIFCISLASAQQFGWKRLSTATTPEPQFYGTHFIDAQHGIVAGDSGSIRVTSDGGATWTKVASGTYARFTRVRYVTPSIVYITGSDGTLLKSQNGGLSWTPIDLKTTMALFDVYFHSVDTGFVAGQAGYLKRTVDGGQTWTSLDSKFGPNNIYAFTFPTRRIGYICGNQGNISKTTNGGATWQDQNSGKSTILLSISFGNEKTGTAVGDNGMMLLTTNGGTRWTQTYATIPVTNAINDIQYVDSSLAFAVGWYGLVLRTTDGGRNWAPQEWEGTDVLESIQMVDANTGFITGYAPVVWTGTVLKTTTGGIVGVKNAGRPLDVDLESVYPQPMSASAGAATFVFTVARVSNVRLTIHDNLGRLVTTVSEGTFNPGEHRASLALNRFVPGTYHVRLTAGDNTRVRPFLVIR